MSEPRRPRPGAGNEALLREILANQAAGAQRVSDLADRLGQTQEDAREARDLGKRIEATLREQDVNARLVELRKEIREELSGMRQDVVHAHTNLKRDLDALCGRVKLLEDERTARGGVKSFVQWVLTYAPWLLAGIAAFVAGLFGRDDILPR